MDTSFKLDTSIPPLIPAVEQRCSNSQILWEELISSASLKLMEYFTMSNLFSFEFENVKSQDN